MSNNTADMIQQYELAKQMKSIGMTDFPQIGKVVERLEMIEINVPRPKPNEVAIKMCASSLYADELYAAQGTALGRFFGPKKVSKTEPYILGSSVAGVIVALGDEVKGLELGQDIISIPAQTPQYGKWSEYCCLEQEQVMQKPAQYSPVVAAGTKMAACVSWGAISFADITPKSRVLVIGASAGLGIMAVQFLANMGAHVTGVCSGINTGMVIANGANEVVDYTKNNFADEALKNNQKYDYVFDFVGGMDAEKDGVRALKKSGGFITVTGPLRYIGENKLSWFQLIRIFGHIGVRSLTSKFRGPRYIFGEKKPSTCIMPALAFAKQHNIEMPISQEVPFEINAIKQALHLLMAHRAKGRIVINFQLLDEPNVQ